MPIKIFLSYAHEDEPLCKELEKQLSSLRRQGLIEVWHDRNISAGTEWEKEISQQLNEAQIILLLISPDFMDSDYCYSIEMERAMERHKHGSARVIPIILRPVYWQKAPFSNLQVLPTDGKPVRSSHWYDQDDALFNVTTGILEVIDELSVLASLERKAIIAYEIRPARFLGKHPTLHIFAKTHGAFPAIQLICRRDRLPLSRTDGELLQRIEPIIRNQKELVIELATTPLPPRTFGKLFLEDDSFDGVVTIYHPSIERLKLT